MISGNHMERPGNGSVRCIGHGNDGLCRRTRICQEVHEIGKPFWGADFAVCELPAFAVLHVTNRVRRLSLRLILSMVPVTMRIGSKM